MTPLFFLSAFLANLLTMGLLVAEFYLFWEWYRYHESVVESEYAQRCLVFALIGLALLAFGKLLVRFVLGKKDYDEPTLVRSAETVRIERPEGHSLFLEMYGPPEGQPLIFIHGWNSNSTQWYYQKKHLATQYRLLLMDLPGLGNSGKPQNKDYSLSKFARDLAAVIALCGDKKPILAGHSIGGMTILTYCQQLDDQLAHRIAGLILIHTTYTNPVRTSLLSGLMSFLQKPVLTPLMHLVIAFSPLVQVMNWLNYLNGNQHLTNHFLGFGGSETRGQLELASYLTTVSPMGVIARGMLAMFDYDATDILNRITVPTLLIAANKDKLTLPKASEYMASQIPGAQLVYLHPCGHMGPTERNAEMNSAITQFIERLSQPGPAVVSLPGRQMRG